MTIQHIKYFIATAECLNFTQAAEQLFISQPSLSRQITAMETELNLLLFIRHRNHTIELTPAGIILLEKFRKIYDIYQQSVAEAQRAAFSITDSLKIGILQGAYTGDFMPAIMCGFMEKYSNVHIDLKYYSFGDLTKQLYSGELDIIITLFFSIEKLDNLNFYIISPSKDHIAMSRNHPLAQKEHFSMNDLKKERFILLSKEDSETSAALITQEFKKIGGIPEFVYAPDVKTMELWVETGYGIAVLDSRNELRFHPNIIFHEFESSWNPSLTAAWHCGNQNPMTSIFMDLLRCEMKKNN